MYRYAPPFGDVLIANPRKSAGKQALCVAVSKNFPMRENRYSYPAGFYVKGTIDQFYVKMVRLIKLEDGSFLFPVPADVRRKMKKQAGDGVNLHIRKDRLYYGMEHQYMGAFFEEPMDVQLFYYGLDKLQQHRFNEWVATARTEEEKVHRIAKVFDAFRNGQNFKEMRKR